MMKYLFIEHKLDWFDWSEWGRCSVSCGNGFQTRHRACIDIVTKEQRPATDCYGTDIQYQTCPYIQCPRK